MTLSPIDVAVRIAAILDGLSIPYAIGGALASSLFGEPRATEDVDLAADIPVARLDALIQALEPEFYVPEGLARQAVARRTSFNVIHRESMRKIDIFLVREDAFSREALSRRRAVLVESAPPRQLNVTSPEDMVLLKLSWYLKTGSASDRQWRDILGMLKVQGARLDRTYLRRWAAATGVLALLDTAEREAGLPPDS